MCRQLRSKRMDNEEAICEDKATSTDDELLSSQLDGSISADITAVAQLWGADLVGLVRPRQLRPHRKALYHQESVSSASDVPKTRHKCKKQRSQDLQKRDSQSEMEGGEGGGKTKELRKQWTTDSSDSGYSKNYSRERLRRQDTEESAESSKKLVKELQRQPTTESSSSVRLTRQSSLRSCSDNQSLFLMRQSTIETYDEFSTTDFSRPQSCNSAACATCPVLPPIIHVESPHCSKDDSQDVPSEQISYIQAPPPVTEEKPMDEFIPNNTGVASSLLTSMSCSLINLSAIELEASQINDIQQSLICASKIQKAHARRKKRRRQIARRAAKMYKEQEKTRPPRNVNKDELPKRVRWSIMATGLVLFLMSIILVGATLRMAPLIDEMVRKENEDIMQQWQAVAVENVTSSASSAEEGLESTLTPPPNVATLTPPTNERDKRALGHYNFIARLRPHPKYRRLHARTSKKQSDNRMGRRRSRYILPYKLHQLKHYKLGHRIADRSVT